MGVKIFKVFLGSPSDVAEERRAAVQVLTELQRRPVYRDAFKIDVVYWDDGAAPVPFASNAGAQESVDIYKGRVSDCDLMLCPLWSRLGTPMKQQGKEYPSGTAYEIDVALSANVPIFFYRRQQLPPYQGKPHEVTRIAAEAQRLEEYVFALRCSDGTAPHFHAHVIDSNAEGTSGIARVPRFENLLRGHLENWLEARFKRAQSASGRVRSHVLTDNIPPRGVGVFVEREQELEALRRPPGSTGLRLVAVVGPSGVGKSELTAEHARTRRGEYPGGVHRIVFVGRGAPDGLAALAHDLVDASRLAGLKLSDQCLQALVNLPKEPCLLLYDNVPDPRAIEPWLPPAGSACDVLVSSTFMDFDERWQRVKLAPFEKPQALQLIRALAGDTVVEDYGDDIGERTQGLPIELCALTRAVKTQVERGRRVRFASLSAATEQSFASVWSLLDTDTRLLLQVAALFEPERVPEMELKRLLVDHHGWSDAAYDEHVAAAMDRAALLPTGEADRAKLHALFCEYVRERQGYTEAAGGHVDLLRAHAARFTQLSRDYARNPVDAVLAGLLTSYASNLRFWTSLPDAIWEDLDGWWVGCGLFERGQSAAAQLWYVEVAKRRELELSAGSGDNTRLGSSLHQVGVCFYDQGEHGEARSWLERAVSEKEKGDKTGRLDHVSLGFSVFQVGMCLYSQGEYSDAKGWFERAVREQELGDTDGNVDRDALGSSLHEIGTCLFSQGKPGEARKWFVEAVAEKERGDREGRVNHESLGVSLHLVGSCFFSEGKYDEAWTWYERAVRETERGDAYGRVDHDSLGNSLHRLGKCLVAQGQYLAAQGWFEKAAQEKLQGDVYGRVDHESLGASLHRVGDCLRARGQHPEARDCFERAFREKEKGDSYGRVNRPSLLASELALEAARRHLLT